MPDPNQTPEPTKEQKELVERMFGFIPPLEGPFMEDGKVKQYPGFSKSGL